MTDQASGLREFRIQQAAPATGDSGFPVTIAVTSGKGGVGKTNIVANLALALIRLKQRVVVLDADFGLANIDVLLALSPKYNLADLLFGEKTLDEIIVEGPQGLRIIPAGSGIQELTNLTPGQELHLFECLAGLRKTCDFLLIDTAAGISKNVIRLLLASSEVIVVTQPEPTAIVDAYAVIKVIAHNCPAESLPVRVLVNAVSDSREANAVFTQISSACTRFLKRDIELIGYIPWDAALAGSVRAQKAVIEGHPNSGASRQFMALAKRIKSAWEKSPRAIPALFRQDFLKTELTIPAES